MNILRRTISNGAVTTIFSTGVVKKIMVNGGAVEVKISIKKGVKLISISARMTRKMKMKQIS